MHDVEAQFKRVEWLVAFRYGYGLLLAILLIARTAMTAGNGFDSSALTFIIVGLVILFVLNWAIGIWVSAARASSKLYLGSTLSLTSIALDMAIAAVVMFVLGNFILAPVLFVIPLVEAMIVGGRHLALGTAVVISIIITAILGLAGWWYGAGAWSSISVIWVRDVAPLIIWYLVIGILGSRIDREPVTAPAIATGTYTPGTLEKLNKDLEKKASELYAKDVELTLANQRLQSLEAAKSKFVTVTTHQLRTPLAAVKWTFEMLEKGQMGPISPEQKEFITKGSESARRIIMIVNDLLNADLFEKETKDSYQFKPIDLAKLLDAVIFEFTNQAVSKHIKLSTKLPSAKLPEIEIDETKLRMALENLIDNALKYTPENGIVTVTVDDAKLNSTNHSLELIISDTGVGIPAVEQSKVFQKFYRASNATRMEPDGTGLGLYIAKDIVEKHHGTIWFETAEGKGTSFHVAIPVIQPRQPGS